MLTADLRSELLAICRRTVELGMTHGSAGNISIRAGRRLLVTPSGIAYDELEAEQMSLMDLDGTYAGPCRPTTEWRLHAAVMRARPDVGAIVHTHAPASTAVACLRRDIPALHYYIALAGGATIRCAPYATYGTQELADIVVATLAERHAVLLANHGLLVVGTTPADALRRTVEIEMLARLYLSALAAGEPVLLTDAEVATAARALRAYGTAGDTDPELRQVASFESADADDAR